MRLLVSLILLAGSGLLLAQAPSALDSALRMFWSADNAQRAAGAVKQVLATAATYDDLAARLKRGRDHAKRPTGRIDLPSRDHGTSLDNIVEIPADYDPARTWPVRVTLHGGVGREAPGPGDPAPRPLTNRIPGS